ncbi:hypothetical protein IGJ28_000277 [Enterococcus sp. AZ091]
MFMDADTPNFIFKGINAVLDMDCIIETELPEISPNKRYEEITVLGRSGSLHETFDDYEPYDLEVESITIPYDRLREVKQWLQGRGQLITHNDYDTYRDVICMMNSPTEFENEWGFFYTFDLTFRCQPFKRKVNEQSLPFTTSLIFHDPGDETAKPYIELKPTGGNVKLMINNISLTITNNSTETIKIDCEHGKIIQGSKTLFSKGEWPLVRPGENKLITTGVSSGTILRRSVYL